MRLGMWSAKYELDACRGCGTSERVHGGQGLCKRCLGRWVRSGTFERVNGRYWSRKYRLHACVECGSSDRKHMADGLCATCYHRRRPDRLGDCDICGRASVSIAIEGMCRTCYARERRGRASGRLCACGCGEETLTNGSNGGNKYVFGHANRGRRQGERERRRRGASLRALYETEAGKELRDWRVEQARRFQASEAGQRWREEMSQRAYAFYESEEGRELVQLRQERLAAFWESEAGDERRALLAKEMRARGWIGSDNPNWRGGLSFEPYGLDWTDGLKELVRDRDGRACQICGEAEDGRSLDVHHIDYDKTNNMLWNLVALCGACHSQTTNGDREEWESALSWELLERMGDGGFWCGLMETG